MPWMSNTRAPANNGTGNFFSSHKLSDGLRNGAIGRHHVYENYLIRGVQLAVMQAKLEKHVSCHSMRHSFSTHLVEAGYDIRTVQELLGHSSVETTMVYTHLMNKGGRGVFSPLDPIHSTALHHANS